MMATMTYSINNDEGAGLPPSSQPITTDLSYMHHSAVRLVVGHQVVENAIKHITLKSPIGDQVRVNVRSYHLHHFHHHQ